MFCYMKKKEVKIEKLVYGGHGLARTDEGVVFISDVLPGEIVRAVIDSNTAVKVPACPQEIITPSAYRRTPPCPYAGECGGCNWLHIEYEEQLRIKKNIFLECIERIGKFRAPEPQIFGSPEFNYRIRAQIKIGQNRSAGFFKQKTNQIVDIASCLLLAEPLNRLFINGAFDGLRGVEILNLKTIAGENSVASFPQIPMFTLTKTGVRAGKYLFEVNGESFFQNNRFLLEKLGTWALDDVGGESCVDLYGGTGFFSVMLAERFKGGLLVEFREEQVQEAIRNFKINKVDNFKAVCGPVEQASRFVKSRPDLLIVDPPRPGLTMNARKEIAKLNASKILYVSCNPSTQARDIAFFVNRAGYKVEKTALFDLYPNTYHLETVMLLSANWSS